MKTLLLFCLGLFCLLSIELSAQENCGTAISIPLSGSIVGDNTGAIPDLDYSTSTGCLSTLYNSAHWYTFTTAGGMSSVILTFTATTIVSPTLTIVDDCANASSFTYQWFDCNASALSGVSQTICDLDPNTIYYIQVATASGDEGSFSIDVQPDLAAPSNDVCETAIELFGGTLECQEFEFPPAPNASACPDYSFGGPCFPVGTPGVWYTFTVPLDMPYGAFTINPISAEWEMYSSATGCSNLVYEACGGGFIFFSPTPGMTYYVLAINAITIQAGWFVENATCVNPLTMLDTGNGTGESDLENNSCEPADPTLPCQNAHVVWYSYTVGCQNADIDIEVDPWLVAGQDGVADDAGILAMLPDCSTVMSAYDMVNGTGYVCSALVAGDILSLSDVPAGTSFLIAVGSGLTFSGYYEIIVNETPVAGGGLTNDDCPTAITLNAGLNTSLHNNCSTQDLLYPTCSSQSAATVWYHYDPSPNIEDITINIISSGIIGPAIAAYDACVNGTLLGEECGNALVITCVDGPIYIQIGSADVNTGGFELDIVTTPVITPPPLLIVANDICSDNSANIELTIPGGLIGDIVVTINSGSSSDINGMMTHTFVGANTAVIDDVLINCGTTTQNAIYTVEVSLPGTSCPSSPQDVTIAVSPKLIATPLSITECLPFDITLDADNIVSGGVAPYVSYTWLWNGLPVGLSNLLTTFPISASGIMTLQVVDAQNCLIETDIVVTAHPALNTLLLADATAACPGDPQVITLTVSESTGGPIALNSWIIYDDQGNALTIGTPLGNMYTIVTDNLDPGNYTASVNSQDINGCDATSNDVIFSIHPVVDGIIEMNTDAMCLSTLDIQFYGPGGLDLYNNGPDSNGDGIPDIIDTNNDGLPDFIDIIWTIPTGGIFNTGQLSFNATQDGIYLAELITDQNCSIILTINVTLPQQFVPVITTNGVLCQGQAISLICSPQTFVSYSWLDANGVEIGTNSTVTVIPLSSPISYTLETVDANGCTNSSTTSITSFISPDIELSGSTSICPGESTIVSVGQDPQLTYEWYDGSNTQLGSDSSSLMIDLAGDYTVIVSAISGCADTLDFAIDENAELAIEIVGNDLCGNVVSTLDGGPGFDNYIWTNEAGDNLGSGQTVDISAPGNYYLDVVLGMCSGIDTIEISQEFPPSLDLVESVDLCNNAGAQSIVSFEDLVATSDAGNWISVDLPGVILTDLSAVDFDMVAMGSYTFIYMTNVAILPCADLTDTLTVNVSDCPCLNPDVEDLVVQCNTTSQFDLDDQLMSDTDSGVWTFGTGPETLSIVGTTVSISGASAGTYEFIYTLDPLPNAGCQESDILVVEIVDAAEAILDMPNTLCNVPSMLASSTLDLGSLLLSGNGNWIDPNITNLDFSDPNNLNFVGVTPGTYTIDFITNNAVAPCSDVTYNIDVIVIDCNCPFIDLQTPDNLCNDNGDLDLNLYEGISDAGAWTADSSNPQDVTIFNGVVDLTASIPGTYIFTYTLDNIQQGCPEFDNISVQLFAPPQITSVEDAEVCNDNSTGGNTAINLHDLIDADPGGVWTDAIGATISDPSNLDFAGLGIGNMYTFTYTTTTAIAPCDNVSADVTILIKDCSCDDPVFLDPPSLCNSPGESIDLDALLVSDHNGEWQIIDQPDGANSVLDVNIFVVEYVVPGDYILEFSLTQDPGPNCPSTFLITVTIVDELVADVLLEADVCTTNNNGDETTYNLMDAINSGSDLGYWTDEAGNIISENLDFLDADPGTFVFTYILDNELPCSQQQYNLTLIAEACSREIVDTGIYIPNVFSPNGDNLNDVFFIQSNISELKIAEMYVFDRWGERIFHLTDFPVNDPSYGWNGIFKSQLVVPGVYQYLVKAVDANGKEIVLVGDLTVLL